MKYSHIVFDVDGTLIDTQGSILLSLRATLERLTGREAPPAEELRFALGIPGLATMERLGFGDEELALWSATLRDYIHTDRVYDGIPELLDALTEGGCHLGLVTSRVRVEIDDDPVLSALLREHPIPIQISADDTDRHKPEPDPLLKYMELTGAQAEDVLYIGDSEYDMSCAQAAGVHSGLAVWGATAEQPCDHRFKRPKDAAKLILR